MTNSTQKQEWNHKYSHFSVETLQNKDGNKIHYSGNVVIGGYTVSFSLNEQIPKAIPAESNPVKRIEYLVRGTVTLLNPSTGNPLLCLGQERIKRKNRQKSSNSEKIIAKKNIYSTTTDQEHLKAMVLTKGRELIAENSVALTRAMSHSAVSISQSTLSLCWQTHGKIFLKNENCKNVQSTFDATSRAISKLPPDSTLEQMSPKVIERNQSNTDQKNRLSRQQIQRLSKFWDYLSRKADLPLNPFHQYLINHSPKRRMDGKKLAIQNATTDHLFPEREYQINQLLAESNDPIALGLSLQKDAGLNTEQILDLVWQDIIFQDEPDFVCIRLSATADSPIQNLTRPVFPFCAWMLHKAHNDLREKYPEKDLSTYPVVSIDGKKFSKKDFTTRLRQYTKGLGIEPEVLCGLADPSHRTSASQRFFLNTYRAKLENDCGLQQTDPSAIRYLLGQPMRIDVTGSFYRSYSSPEGLRKLYVAMRRFGTGLEEKSNRCEKSEIIEDGRCTIQAKPKDGRKLVEIIAEFKVEPGDFITLFDQYGLDAKIEFLDESGEVIEDVEYISHDQAQIVL